MVPAHNLRPIDVVTQRVKVQVWHSAFNALAEHVWELVFQLGGRPRDDGFSGLFEAQQMCYRGKGEVESGVRRWQMDVSKVCGECFDCALVGCFQLQQQCGMIRHPFIKDLFLLL